MSRTRYVIDGELDDPSKSPHAFWGPYVPSRRTRSLTVTRWQRLARWMRATFQLWNCR